MAKVGDQLFRCHDYLGDLGEEDGAVGRCDSRNFSETSFDAPLMLC